MSIEFDIGGQTYRAAKLDAFAQLHLSRKIAPVLPKLLPAVFKVAQSGKTGIFAALANPDEAGLDSDAIVELSQALEPVAEVLASMPDQDAEYVYSACLSVVMRRQADSWTPVWNRQHAACMFDDVDLGVMTQLVARVTMDSLGGFIRGLLAKTESSPRTTALNGHQ